MNDSVNFLGKKHNNINKEEYVSNVDYINNKTDINVKDKYTIEEIANILNTNEQFIKDVTGIKQNVMSYNDLIAKFCVKNKDGKYVLYRDIINRLYNGNTLDNYYTQIYIVHFANV